MFKSALLVTLALATSTQATLVQQNITISDVIHLMAGVMDGIVHEDRLDYLLGCVNGSEAMVDDIESAVSDFSEGGFWGITEGIYEIKQFIFNDLPSTITNCGDMGQDFDKLGNFFDIFSNTTLLVQRVSYNLLWYYSDIMAQVNAAEDAWNAGEFFTCGERVGDALVLACGDHSTFLNDKEFIKRSIEGNRQKQEIPENIKALLSLMKQ